MDSFYLTSFGSPAADIPPQMPGELFARGFLMKGYYRMHLPTALP